MTKTRIVVSAVELLRNHSKLTLAPLAPRKSTPKSITAVLALRRARDDEGQSAFHALSQVIPAPFPSPALGPSSGYDTSAKVLLPRSFSRERGSDTVQFLARPRPSDIQTLFLEALTEAVLQLHNGAEKHRIE